MKKVIFGFIFLLFIIFPSCEEPLLLVKCSDCNGEEPSETELEIKLDMNVGAWVSAIVRVYEGNIDDSLLLGTFELTDDNFQYPVPVNKKYTVSATYDTGDATYVAIDSTTPKVHYETEQCDKPCYYVYNRKINLNIKYTK
jgi:hypothetical protein